MGLKMIRDYFGEQKLVLLCDACREQLDIGDPDNFVTWKKDKPYFVHGGKCANKIDPRGEYGITGLRTKWKDLNSQHLDGSYKRPK